MSAPGQEFREAEYLGLGYLAVTSSELLDKLIAGEQLDDDDKYTLRRAENFLRDVSSGARLVTSGVQGNASAIDAVQKLAYSVEPLKLMQDRVKSEEVGEAFEKVAASIESELGEAGSGDKADLQIATHFFRELYIFLSTLVDAGKRRTGIDPGGLGGALLGYA